ncbi:MAG: hypothetical protein FWG40_07775 [Peptococcaceae bacterium]|nr:hypothetical protein [Peptococcaceae bacterium]
MDEPNTRFLQDLQQTDFAGEQGETFSCPHCGGLLVFDISSQAVKCEQCDGLAEMMPTSPIQERVLVHGNRNYGSSTSDSPASEELDRVWQEQMSLIHCESCGNDIVVPQSDLVALCEYCGSSKVLAQKAAAGIPPDGVIPFTVDKHSAGESFRKWITRRFWAPRSLKRGFHENKLESVYLPYWTFDAQADAVYTARGGKVYYVMEGIGENRRRVRKVRWYPVRGTISRFFDDILVNATKTPTRQGRDKLMARVENFGTQALLPFNTAYLSGFKAEKYTTTPEQGFEEAKTKMMASLKEQARREVLRYYDEISSLNVKATYSRTTFKHILVPFWLSSYWYMDKPYRFVVNAQTGKVSGEAPVSKVKVALAVAAGAIVLVLALMLYLNYSNV